METDLSGIMFDSGSKYITTFNTEERMDRERFATDSWK